MTCTPGPLGCYLCYLFVCPSAGRALYQNTGVSGHVERRQVYSLPRLRVSGPVPESSSVWAATTTMVGTSTLIRDTSPAGHLGARRASLVPSLPPSLPSGVTLSRSLHTHQASRALPTQDSNHSSYGEPALEGTVPLCCVRCMSMSAARRPYLVRTEPLQLADGLLKLNVPGAGFLADIRRMCLCCSRRHRPSPTDTQQGQCPTRRAAQGLR
jgi:hypothetical protein